MFLRNGKKVFTTNTGKIFDARRGSIVIGSNARSKKVIYELYINDSHIYYMSYIIITRVEVSMQYPCRIIHS